MTETDWMYDSLTERFGETLGDRQRVVDALLIAKAIVGPGPLGSSNIEGTLSIARFILDEWGKHSDAEDPEDEPEFLFYSDLDRIRTKELDISPDDVWVTPTGWRVHIRDGKFSSIVTDMFGDRLETPSFVPNKTAFPLTKEN